MKCAFFQGSTEHEMPSFMHMMYYVHIVSHFDSSSQWNLCDKCVRKQGKKNDKRLLNLSSPQQREVAQFQHKKAPLVKGGSAWLQYKKWLPPAKRSHYGKATLNFISLPCAKGGGGQA